jgi:hypothetical protein
MPGSPSVASCSSCRAGAGGGGSAFRHGRRIGAAVAGAAVAGTAAALVARDIAASVEVNLTIRVEQLLELGAGALHAGLHTRRGQAEPGRRARLGEPLELGQRERFSLLRGEPSQQRAQALGQLAAKLRRNGLRQDLLLAV